MNSTAFVYDNKSSKISFDHFQQILDVTSAVISWHVLRKRLTLMQGRIGTVEILEHVNCLWTASTRATVGKSLSVLETMLFPNCGFFGFKVPCDAQFLTYHWEHTSPTKAVQDESTPTHYLRKHTSPTSKQRKETGLLFLVCQCAPSPAKA